MAAGGSYTEMVLSQLIINLRYSPMSISLSQKADESMTVPARFLIGFGVTDEIFAVAMAKNKTIGRIYMAGLILLPYIGWTMGTLCGAVVGNIIPDKLSMAMGIAIYAMFLAIILPPVRKERGIAVVVAIAAAASCLIEYTPVPITSGFKVIIVGVAASALGAVIYPVGEQKE